MKDLIDERNFREMCSRSIVKSYNVHYMTQEEIEAQKKEKEKAEETVPEVPGRSYASEELTLDEGSNEYGMETEDPVTREQIEKILGEREESFMENLLSAVDEQQQAEQMNDETAKEPEKIIIEETA